MPEDTIITCKHFLDAVEDELYGWRWECPNAGVKCQYRHMLPEGYVVISKKEREANRKDAVKNAEDAAAKTLEEQIEEERAALPSEGLTPVTKESFFAWKDRRKARKQKELEDRMREEELKKVSKGRKAGGGGGGGKNSIMNGRALFSYNPDLFTDADGAADATAYEEEGADNNEESKVAEDADQITDKQAAVDQALFQGEGADEDVDFD